MKLHKYFSCPVYNAEMEKECNVLLAKVIQYLAAGLIVSLSLQQLRAGFYCEYFKKMENMQIYKVSVVKERELIDSCFRIFSNQSTQSVKKIQFI